MRRCSMARRKRFWFRSQRVKEALERRPHPGEGLLMHYLLSRPFCSNNVSGSRHMCREQSPRLSPLKRWHRKLSRTLSELTLFWKFLAVALVKSEDDSLLFVHGSKTDLEGLQQALACVNCLPYSEARERPTFWAWCRT